MTWPDIRRHTYSGPPPELALQRLLSVRKQLGITRIADVTGLDRLGIPVMQAITPFSLSNSVSQGKGSTAIQAAISAIFESAETFFAEKVARFDVTVASAAKLGVDGAQYEWHKLMDAPQAWSDRATTWVLSEELLSNTEEFVPFELVHTAYVHPKLPYDGIFASSTTGLAAGFSEANAVTHGILECIERDALARTDSTHGFLHRFRIDETSISVAPVCELIESLKSKGILVGLFHAPSPTGLPVISCQLMESDDVDRLLPFQADGSAANCDPVVAATQAIYEAAQTRVGAISGARDDLSPASYPRYPDWTLVRAHQNLLQNGPRPIDFNSLQDGSSEPQSVDDQTLLATLADAGIPRVHVVRLNTAPLADLSAVKIIVPALRPLLEH